MEEQSAKILIVDDSPGILKALATMLVAEGFAVQQATDGDEAIGVAKREQPDLILMDIVMPRLSGLAACQILRADSRFNQTPIILLTSEDTPETIAHGLSLGANDYIIKGTHFEELLARIRRHLSMHYAFRQQISTERFAALGQIAISIQHEINNPLTSVTGFLDLVLRMDDLPDKARHYLQKARADAVRIREVVSQLDGVEDRRVNPHGFGEMIDLTARLKEASEKK